MSEALIIETDGSVGVVRLNRPEARNALSAELMTDLAEALKQFDRDEGIRCIVVAGCNDVFASGADLRSPPESGPQQDLHDPTATFWKRLAEVETPTIAAVSGWALGAGFELALACDLVVAAEKSQFGQPEITLGIIPGGGATQRLTHILGKHRAMELVLTGKRISAEEARAWGLVNVLAQRGGWLEEATQLAHEVSLRSPVALRLAKQAVLTADNSTLDDGLETERRLFGLAMATEDRVEGMEAFTQGRPPKFKGR